MQKVRKCACFLIILATVSVAAALEPASDPPDSRQPFTIALWPQGAPGEKGDIGPEKEPKMMRLAPTTASSTTSR
jgi:hypothetical protein